VSVTKQCRLQEDPDADCNNDSNKKAAATATTAVASAAARFYVRLGFHVDVLLCSFSVFRLKSNEMTLEMTGCE
jgi:hypothetical protein